MPGVRANELDTRDNVTEDKIKKHTHLVEAADAVLKYSGVGVWARHCDDTTVTNTRWVVRLRGPEVPPVVYLLATRMIRAGDELVTPRTSILHPLLA